MTVDAEVKDAQPPRWISLCCGLAATECLAMTGAFPPVTRMGGKRGVSHHVLDILGTWPTRWLMIDADVAIVEFWQAAFGGWLPAVAEIIRSAPCDGEQLWKLWMNEPVPFHPLERVARWIVGQKGNFSGKPLSYEEKWENASYGSYGKPQRPAAAAAGWSDASAVLSKDLTANRVEAFWEGLAGYKRLSDLAVQKGFTDQVAKGPTSDRVDNFSAGPGSAMYLDLATSSPVFQEGDLVSVDPPYQGTTGYGAGLTRERVVELAEEAHEAGCRVIVHEAETVLNGGPWRHVELERRHWKNADTWRKGRKNGEPGERRQEWLTLNFEPARTVSHTMAPTRIFTGFEGPLFPRGDRDPAGAEPETVYLLGGDR